MDIAQIIAQVSEILKSDSTPYKKIPLKDIPQDKLLEFLLFNRQDIPDGIKNKFISNLVSYGFITNSNLRILNNNSTLRTSTNGARSNFPIVNAPVINSQAVTTVIQAKSSIPSHPAGCGSCPFVV